LITAILRSSNGWEHASLISDRLNGDQRGESMEKQKLGKIGLEVSAIGLGCMGMSANCGPPEDKVEMISLLYTGVDRGITFFDTTEAYGPFINEELLGEGLAPVRDQVVIVIKFGCNIDPKTKKRLDGFKSRPAPGSSAA